MVQILRHRCSTNAELPGISAGSEIFGLPHEKLVGQSLKDLIKPEDYCKIVEETTKRKQKIKSTYDIEIIRPDGTKRILLITATPRYSQEGEYIGSLGVFRDITERKRADENLKRSYEQLKNVLEETITSLSTALGKRDPYTLGHQNRVTKLACAIAEELRLSKEQIEGIRVAGLLHDIGKLHIPSEILVKPAKLTVPEFEIIKTHPQAGYEIIKGIEFPWPVANIVLQHHEKLDGSGYPKGLKDQEILFESKILTVADVTEAMSSHRPYRPSLGLSAALDDIVHNAGKLYDKEVAMLCHKLFKEADFKFD